MGTEEELVKKIEQYKEIGQADPSSSATGAGKKVDVAALAMAALADVQRQEMDVKKARRAYWISFLLPPIGLFVAVYYLLSGKPGAKRVAFVCTILTVATLLASWFVLQMFVSSIPADQLQQLQTVNPNELLKNYKDLTQ